jgi:hypothetical protein
VSRRGAVGGAYKRDIPSRFVASKCAQGVDVQLHCLEDRHAICPLDALANCAKPRDIGRRSDDGSIVFQDLIRRAEPIQWKLCLIPLMALVQIRLFPLQMPAVVVIVLAD